MKKLGVVITDGVGFRNFILTDFIKEAKSQFDEVVIFSCLPATVYEDFQLNCTIIELDVFEEKFKTWFFRKAKELAHLQLFSKNNFGINDNLQVSRTNSKSPRGYATRLLFVLTSFLNSEKWIKRFDAWQQLTFKNHYITKKYGALLQENQITMLFFTHQRPPFIAPLIFAASRLRITTATFIFSWDNLGSKGRMAGDFNRYIVWSELMKSELMHFYRSVTPNLVAVSGTPQFESYVDDRFGYGREELFSKFSLDPAKPLVFFTCNDSSSKNDPLYLEILARFITGKKLAKDINLIVRTSPAEVSPRFDALMAQYEFIAWNHPDWPIRRANHQEAWTQRVPTIADANDLKSLLQHCDLNINILSTITLDSFLFDKPVVNPVFGNSQKTAEGDAKFLKFQHLVELVKSDASEIARNEAEFLEAINKILTGNDDRQKQRKQFVDLQIGKPLAGTSKRIATILSNWS